MSKFLLVILVFILLSSFKGIFRNLVAELKKKGTEVNVNNATGHSQDQQGTENMLLETAAKASTSLPGAITI